MLYRRKTSSDERPLSDAERTLARSVFGNALDYDAVRIVNRKWAFFQPRHVTMAPQGSIHFHPAGGGYCGCFGAATLGRQGLLIHELVHVWQHQRGMNLILRRHPFCRYSYSIKPGWGLEKYGIEQQAEIVKHAFWLRNGVRVAGIASRETYDLLVRFPGAKP